MTGLHGTAVSLFLETESGCRWIVPEISRKSCSIILRPTLTESCIRRYSELQGDEDGISLNLLQIYSIILFKINSIALFVTTQLTCKAWLYPVMHVTIICSHFSSKQTDKQTYKQTETNGQRKTDSDRYCQRDIREETVMVY